MVEPESFDIALGAYDRLRTSELLEYEEKVQNARKAAEVEFREQFLAHLQENMKQAQNEFKELNRALKDIRFSFFPAIFVQAALEITAPIHHNNSIRKIAYKGMLPTDGQSDKYKIISLFPPPFPKILIF